MGDLKSLETIIVVQHADNDAPMDDGRDHWYHELLEAADDECPAEGFDAEHPLFILYSSGSTAKPKGILHTTGGYLTGVAYTHKVVFDLKPEEDVYWCSADVGWVTGHSYIVYGPLANGATSVMYEGAPDYPDKDIWWELCERYGVTLFYTAPTAIRACMKWGEEYPEKHDLSSLRLLGHGRRADQPEGVALVPHRDRRRALPDRRHLVADRDRPHHDRAAAGDHRDQAGLGDAPLPGIEAQVVNEDDGEDAGTDQGLLTLRRPWPGMLRTLYGDHDRFIETYWDKFGRDVYFVGDAARKDEDGYFWVIGRVDDVLNVSGHRMSTAEIESAIVSHSKVAEAAVIGQQDEDTGQSVAAFVTLEGTRRAPTSSSRTSASTSPSGSASSRGPSASSGPTTCRRRARARSCAGCCATSPRAASSATSPRCATPT